MILYFIAALFLLAAVICFIRCFVLHRKSAKPVAQSNAAQENITKDITVVAGAGDAQSNSAYEKKATRLLLIGIILSVLTEAAILLADKVTA